MAEARAEGCPPVVTPQSEVRSITVAGEAVIEETKCNNLEGVMVSTHLENMLSRWNRLVTQIEGVRLDARLPDEVTMLGKDSACLSVFTPEKSCSTERLNLIQGVLGNSQGSFSDAHMNEALVRAKAVVETYQRRQLDAVLDVQQVFQDANQCLTPTEAGLAALIGFETVTPKIELDLSFMNPQEGRARTRNSSRGGAAPKTEIPIVTSIKRVEKTLSDLGDCRNKNLRSILHDLRKAGNRDNFPKLGDLFPSSSLVYNALAKENTEASCRDMREMLLKSNEAYEQIKNLQFERDYSNQTMVGVQRSLQAFENSYRSIYARIGLDSVKSRIEHSCQELKSEMSDLYCKDDASLRSLLSTSDLLSKSLHRVSPNGSPMMCDGREGFKGLSRLASTPSSREGYKLEPQADRLAERTAETNAKACQGFLAWRSEQCGKAGQPSCEETSGLFQQYCERPSAASDQACRISRLASYAYTDGLVAVTEISGRGASRLGMRSRLMSALSGEDFSLNRPTVARGLGASAVRSTDVQAGPSLAAPRSQERSQARILGGNPEGEGRAVALSPIPSKTSSPVAPPQTNVAETSVPTPSTASPKRNSELDRLTNELRELEKQFGQGRPRGSGPRATPRSAEAGKQTGPSLASAPEESDATVAVDEAPGRSSGRVPSAVAALPVAAGAQTPVAPVAASRAAAIPLGFSLPGAVASSDPRAPISAEEVRLRVQSIEGVDVLTREGELKNFVELPSPQDALSDRDSIDYIRQRLDPSLVPEGGEGLIVQFGRDGSLWKVVKSAGVLSIKSVGAAEIKRLQRTFRTLSELRRRLRS